MINDQMAIKPHKNLIRILFLLETAISMKLSFWAKSIFFKKKLKIGKKIVLHNFPLIYIISHLFSSYIQIFMKKDTKWRVFKNF